MMRKSAAASTFQARYLFPGDGPPILDGRLSVVDGQVVAVGPQVGVGEVHDFGNAAILPGLCNVHTHLEFSDLSAPLGEPGTTLPEWIELAVAHRRQRQADPETAAALHAQAVTQGLAASVRSGATTIGEIATPGWPPAAFVQSPAAATVFLELLGLAADRMEPLLESARRHVQAAGPDAAWRPGLSPHAPYTVRPELVAQVCRLSAESQVPVAMHLAECFEELELLQSASGPLVHVLQSLEAWDPTAVPRGVRVLDYLQTLSQAHRALVIHGNFLVSEELHFLAAHADRMSLVYCPRTHARFCRGRYALAEALAAGVTVALGTDSCASSPDLSLLEEMRAAYFLHPDVPAEQILQLGTVFAPKALGRDHVTGTLRSGLRADFVVVPLPDRDAADPHELLFESDTSVAATVCGGQAPFERLLSHL